MSDKMKYMDNAKMITVLETFTVAQYLQNLTLAPLRKITLFSALPYSGAANTADPHSFVVLADLKKILDLSCGCIQN